MKRLNLLATLFFAGLLAMPALAQKSVAPGYDLWTTVGDGSTFMDFADSPVPAGFFFDGSPAFTGRIDFVGVPLASQPAGVLGGADTIIERLDTAHFGEDGVAYAPMRIKALSLAAAQPIDIDGTLWDVTAVVADKQPVTEIAYYAESEETGRYFAELVINVKMVFTHHANKKLSYALERTVHFPEATMMPYRLAAPDSARAKQSSNVLGKATVDVDGDGVPESGFPMAALLEPDYFIAEPEYEYCDGDLCISEAQVHTAPTHQHTTTATRTTITTTTSGGGSSGTSLQLNQQ